MRKLLERGAAAFKAARPALPAITRDVTGFAGALLVLNGVRLIYAPAAWIIAGVLMFALAATTARPKA